MQNNARKFTARFQIMIYTGHVQNILNQWDHFNVYVHCTLYNHKHIYIYSM